MSDLQRQIDAEKKHIEEREKEYDFLTCCLKTEMRMNRFDKAAKDRDAAGGTVDNGVRERVARFGDDTKMFKALIDSIEKKKDANFADTLDNKGKIQKQVRLVTAKISR